MAAFDLGDRQPIAGDIVFRVFIEQDAKTLGGQAGGFFVVELDAGTDQLIAQTVFGAAEFGLLGAVAGVGDARFCHRVSEQKLRWTSVKTVLAHQAFKHGRHGAWVVACFLQIKNADTVCFLFVLPRKASLLLHGGGLGASNGGDPCVTSACGGNDNPGE